MSKALTFGIIVSALGFGAAAAAVGTVSSRVTSLGSTIERLQARQRNAMQSMDREWVYGGNNIKKYAHEVEKLDSKILKLTQHRARLQALNEQHASARGDMNGRFGDVAAAYGMGQMLAAPVGAFVRQDDALNALQVAMMSKTGQVGESYEQLRKKTIELGNSLPGTTTDFANAARTLLDQGVAIKSVLGGGLTAASHLSVVLRMPAEAAAEMTAKLLESYKLANEELPKMADSMQRAKFTFGLKPSDLMAANSYMAPMLRQLELTGIENTNRVLALQGMSAQVGLEGSAFGTNFSMMLSRMAKGPQMIEDATKGTKGHVREMLEQSKVSFDFFDKSGNYKGLEPMIAELEKLKIIRAKFGDQGAMQVSEAMFGAEAARPALILADQGVKGFREAQQRMADQASLQQRIDKTLTSSSNTWQSLTGSIENFAAAAAGPAVQALHPMIDGLNTAAGKLTKFADENPRLAKYLGLTTAALLGGGVAFLTIGAAMSVARFALLGAQLIPGVLLLGRGFGLAGSLLRGVPGALLGFGRAAMSVWPLVAAFGKGLVMTFIGPLMMAGKAVIFLGRALLMNPIGLIIAGIAVAGYLIYKNWSVIAPFLGRVWSTVKSAFAAAWTWIKGLPQAFMEMGRNLIDGLISGVTSRLTAARDRIVSLGQSIKGWFTSVLGIQSPSRVFMGYGQNIGQGAQQGIMASVPGVKTAVRALSAVALGGALGGAMAAQPTQLAKPALTLPIQLQQPAALPALSSAQRPGMQAPEQLRQLPALAVRDAAASPAPSAQAVYNITFSPNITVTGSAKDAVPAQIQQGLQLSMRDLEVMLRRLQAEQSRKAH